MEALNNAIVVNNFADSVIELIITLVVVVLIWVIGNWVLGLILSLVSKINIPGTKLDDKVLEKFKPIISIAWKLILITVILDYIGVGQIIISALLGGISLTIAIALGLSFGDALKPYAKDLVDKFAKEVKHKK